jgi:acyl-CoA thioesterase II
MFAQNSSKCYFLLSASPSVPIIYLVERIREGRSYTTRSVKATQEGRIVFMLVCSFQRPEPWQPSQQWTMPSVPGPDDLEFDKDRWTRLANRKGTDPLDKKHLLSYAAVRMHTGTSSLFTDLILRNGPVARSASRQWLMISNLDAT